MIDEFRADLHCHSVFSDGTFSPLTLLTLAKESGLQGISITDHDSVGAYLDGKIFENAKKLNLSLVVGVEISSDWKGTGVHILGYEMDYRLKDFQTFLQSVQDKRTLRIRGMIAKLMNKGIEISFDSLHEFVQKNSPCQSFSIGRAHLGRFLVEKGYVKTMKEAFDKYLKDGASCYVSGEKHSSLLVIEKIHQAGGKALIAHPHLIKKKRVANQLLDLPFDGVEGYYGTISFSQEKRWLEVAQEKGWIISGGSDFHGPSKPSNTLGCSWTNKENFIRIMKK